MPGAASTLCRGTVPFGYGWRGGRAVEGARLESVYTVLSGIEGSNPSPSASLTRDPATGLEQSPHGLDVPDQQHLPSTTIICGLWVRALVPVSG